MVLKMSALPALMLHQWVFLSWQDVESLCDVIHVNEPSAIDHQLVCAMQTFVHSGWRTVDGGCCWVFGYSFLNREGLITCLSRLSQEASVCFNYSSPLLPKHLFTALLYCMHACVRERKNVLDAATFLILKINLSLSKQNKLFFNMSGHLTGYASSLDAVKTSNHSNKV